MMPKLSPLFATTRFGYSLLLLAIVLTLTPTRAVAQTIPHPDHIVIVIEENHSYGQIIGESQAKYLNELAEAGAVLTKFYALHHPSQPNYFVLFSGGRQEVFNDDCNENSAPLPNRSLGGQLTMSGRSFKGYAEGLPEVGWKGCHGAKYKPQGPVTDEWKKTVSKYERKHAPWISFEDVKGTDSHPFSDFPTDFTQLPTVAFVIPNMVNDMHDGIFGVRRKKGDKWLRNNLKNYADWAKTHNSLLIIIWDEDDKTIWFPKETTKPPANHIAAIFVGEMVKPGFRSNIQYTHLDFLRTLQEMYGLGPLPGTQNSIVISDIWK